MKVIKEDWRSKLLVKQLKLDNNTREFKERKKSFHRLFDYIYFYTDIVYIDFIDEKILYNYIKYHSKNEQIYYTQAIKDVKSYIAFLKMDKENIYIPKVDLSLKNYMLWISLS